MLDLKNRGYHTLRKIARGARDTDRKQQWLSQRDIELREEDVETWENYTRNLRRWFTKLEDDEDRQIQFLNPTRNYEPRIRYKALAVEGNDNP